ncbi:diaminopimelate decarboxylase [Tuwongella immobilis]|uniref:Diaminopimelate decarboxylase n=1 Tax=Tuwongella immobilis TaxID=692036 RepID=A0A6C2YMK1_9BACT|nr:diaminopimelate decarboxylase [Tuwongella immobilis]VIP02439.1 diaminopimelate decarboxylase : Diaminopimelate decarboxylase OS=Planctomyces limnophilus (strain ATCC 43296 / DSM 3776 / IFAM 1008 / 290) GN=lysA PE=3 SV=1: Orn_Arg_deC_N: Orn_DAP_Arg_deC [Tuwongella immobilis]VTS01401.1 diaminopimelate decarboxylase : Diaminopimelate decarboxylase OS=Planctomyces limnophilus (strain ATCC 43296 / DSM 3776 / IFAM 1008 / 290) GN=lysA PE=3 SV=1: Orn_Arg_deC_N: Orn_DAP_Arg_deC [Tuwongella immobilis]
MDHFQYCDGQLYCEKIPVAELAAKYGTPLFIYSEATLLHHLKEIQSAFAAVNPVICYSVKSNGNLSIAKLMVDHGAGCDVTSGGELYRALKAGTPGNRIVFAGVGKSDDEMRMALEAGVLLFDVESEAELHVLGEVAKSIGKVAPVALRVNPALPPKTHVKTDTSVKGTKFGFDIDTVLEVAQGVVGHPGLSVVGLHMHLGSPILSSQPYSEGSAKAIVLIDALRKQGHPIEYLNMGGGFGIHYRKQEALPAKAFADVILPAVHQTGCRLVLEPGRFIVGNAGVLISRVVFTKESGGKRFIIQDAGMNDLIRPTLYDSFHRIWPVQPQAGLPTPPIDFESEIPDTFAQDVVGPVCESGDFLAKDRRLPLLKRGDLICTFSAGAYGMSMASNYNARVRAAEVLVTGDTARLIRRRETFDDLIAPEVDCLS